MIDIYQWQKIEDLKFRASLVQARLEANLTVGDLALAMATTVDGIVEIEDFRSDPHMHTIRRYAAAIGVVYRHQVIPVPKEPDPEPDPETLLETP